MKIELNKIYLGDAIEVMQGFECPVCGKKFNKKLYKKVQAVYCSQECAYKGRTLGFTKRTITEPYKMINSLKDRIKKNCEICNKEFEIIKSKITKTKYCSRKCFEIAHRENMLGEKNPSYKNGSSYLKREWRGDNWEKLRKEIYKRDNYICQDCGIKCIGKRDFTKENSDKIIQCHHIENYKRTKNNNNSNLITLCLKCHLIRHN